VPLDLGTVLSLVGKVLAQMSEQRSALEELFGNNTALLATYASEGPAFAAKLLCSGRPSGVRRMHRLTASQPLHPPVCAT
jgi:hypothetical protein